MSTSTTQSTSTQLTAPETLTSLASSAILVAVEIHSRTFSKKDSKIAREVSAERGARTVAGSWQHDLFVGDADLEALLNYRAIVYNWIKSRTYDWAGSTRLLPMVNFPRFMQEYNQHVANYSTLRDTFLARYEEKINSMAFARGPMFNRGDYPSIQELRNAYTITLHRSPVPSNDFRVRQADDIREDLHNTYQAQVNDIVDRMVNSQIDALVKVMDSISRGCSTYTSTDKNGNVKEKRGRVYETMIEQALDLCDVYREFNTTNNSLLEQARVRLATALTDVSADTLRNNETQRTRVKDEVDSILSLFGAKRA